LLEEDLEDEFDFFLEELDEECLVEEPDAPDPFLEEAEEEPLVELFEEFFFLEEEEELEEDPALPL
jgi:hypothetical protein